MSDHACPACGYMHPDMNDLVVDNRAVCSECGMSWFLRQVFAIPDDWVGPCCRPVGADGKIRNLEGELNLP